MTTTVILLAIPLCLFALISFALIWLTLLIWGVFCHDLWWAGFRFWRVIKAHYFAATIAPIVTAFFCYGVYAYSNAIDEVIHLQNRVRLIERSSPT